MLLVVALLGVAAPLTAAAFAQSGGAGDQQYSDPFGNDDSSSGSGNSNSGSGSSSSNSDSDSAPLTQAPQTSGSGSSGSAGSGSSSSGAGAAGTSTSPTTPAASGTLPDTGLDARVLVLLGVILVLAGIGLWLRNAPERF